jgi:diguanylate cyclase (GGDEF)-like protein/PAS domain S-box-containing protein
MISVANLPLWAKSLIAPAVVLIAMFTMAGAAFVDLANQKANIAYLDGVAFEDLRKAMVATEAVTDFETELYHLSSIASNETDQPQVDEMSARLTARLGAIAPLIKAIVARENSAAIENGFAGYDWSAREMIEFTRHDAAYGVMMMNYVEPLFEHFQGLLTETSARAQQERGEATADLLAGLERMRFAFLALVLGGAAISITTALLIARTISAPTVRLTRTMVRLAGGSLEVEVPDLRRRDEIGAMAIALEVFKENMIKARAAEARVQQSEQRFRDLFESTRDAILVTDVVSRRFISANSSALKMFGETDSERFLAHEPLEYSPEWQPDGHASAEKAHEAIATAISEGTHFFEWMHARADGTPFPADVLLTRVVRAEETLIYATIRDISMRKQADEQILRMARLDNLTGLVNRRAFVEILEQTIARAQRDDTCFAVLYLDLDHFKDVNDTLSHPVGDMMLKAVAERLRASVRDSDTVSRFGGDEFAIILNSIAEPANTAVISERLLGAIDGPATLQTEVAAVAARVAEQIVKAVAEPIQIQANRIHSGATLGIAIYGPESPDAEAMLSHADVALYQAKSAQRGTYHFFTDGMDAEVRARVSMSAELREAIASDEFFLMYQPQVDIDTGQIVGLEALVRWHHPRLGVLGPGKFIPESERNGLIAPLGRWIMGEACRQTGHWLDAGIAPLVAVNLSGIQFKRPHELERDIAAAMAEAGLPPRLLELELTESVLMEASRDHNELLLRLRRAGYRIAIDDFGSGYSSLDYLRRYPVDRVKIDQTFIADIGIEPGNDAIVRAALGLARELNIQVVVEGVETVRQLELLKSWGGRIVQGYHFARPLPAPEMSALLRIGKITPAPARARKITVPA